MVADRGGRRNNVCSYFFVNDRVMYSPTTSPSPFSSFGKEENGDTIDFLVSPPKNVNRIVADGRVFSFSNSVEL